MVQEPLQQSLIAWSVEHAPKVFPGWELDEPDRLMLEVIQEALEGKDQRVLLCPSARSRQNDLPDLGPRLGSVSMANRCATTADQLDPAACEQRGQKDDRAVPGKRWSTASKSKSSQEWAPNWADGLTQPGGDHRQDNIRFRSHCELLWLDDVVGSFEDASNPHFHAIDDLKIRV